MKNKILILLVSLALAIVPSSVFADTQGFYDLNKVIYVHYAVNDGTLHYDSTIKDTSIVHGSTSPFYLFNQGVISSIHTNNNVLYTPAFFKYFSDNTMNLCNDSCDLMLSFSYGLASYNTHNSLDDSYMNAFRRSSTNFSGIKIVGTDIYNNPKEFYCTGQYLIGGDIGSLDGTYNKFIATCPTSNFKSISYILVSTGFRSVYNTTTTLNYTYFIDDLDYTISAYTGTQDGIGGSSSNNDEPTEEEILDSITDDDIDSSFQNQTMNDINSQMASNNVISDLLLLPVRMYQSILNSLGSNSCVAYNLGSLYGTNLQLPCIQVQNYIGSELWTTIDLIFCGMFILVIRKKFVDIFNNMTNLKNGGNEIE